MRSLIILAALLVVTAVPASAQTQAEQPAAPPVPDARPPALLPLDDNIEPQVTIRQREGDTVEEYRVNGKLYKIKVIPERGEPYFLIDPRGDGTFVRQDGPGTPGLSVPMWVIGTF